MARRVVRASLGLLVCSAAVAAAACGVSTNPESAGPTPTPSHTVTPTPVQTATPTPSPTATPKVEPAGTCSFVWASDNLDGTYDLYEADVDGRHWVSGAGAFDGKGVSGYWIQGYDPVAQTFTRAGMTTAGAITLQVSGTHTGDAAGFGDAGGKSYWAATYLFAGSATTLGRQTATGGAGSFTGVLSDPNPSVAPTYGQGTVDVTIGSTDELFGGQDALDFDYAVCTTATTSSLTTMSRMRR